MRDVTPRQIEAVQAHLDTGTMRAAGELLGISPHTVAHHIAAARDREGVETTEQLVCVLTAAGHLAWRASTSRQRR